MRSGVKFAHLGDSRRALSDSPVEVRGEVGLDNPLPPFEQNFPLEPFAPFSPCQKVEW